MASNYQHGSMEITEQNNTFSSFISWSLWGGLLVGLGVFGLVLVFGSGFAWFTSVVLMSVLGAVLGFLLKMPVSWYVTLGGIFGLSTIIALLEAFIGFFI